MRCGIRAPKRDFCVFWNWPPKTDGGGRLRIFTYCMMRAGMGIKRPHNERLRESEKEVGMTQGERIDAIGEFTLTEKVALTSAGKQSAGYEILDSAGNVEAAFGPSEKDAASRALHELASSHGYVLTPIAADGVCSVWKKVVNGKTIYVVRVGNIVEFFDSYDKAMEAFSGAVKRERRRPSAGSTPGF